MPYKPAYLKTRTFKRGKGKKQYASKRKAGKSMSKMSVRKVQGISGGITETALVAGSYKALRKGLSKLGAPTFYQITASGDLATATPLATAPASGRQCPAVLAQWNSVSDIFGLASNVPAIVTTFAVSPTRLHIHGIKGVITMNNPTSQTMVVDLYDVCAKMDLPTVASSGAPYAVALPTQAWETSMTQQSFGTALPYAASTQLGAQPTDGQLFKDYYKVVGKQSIVLPQNGSHIHTVSLKLDKNFDKGELDIQAQYLNGFKGFTYFTMAVVRGQPCYDSDANQTSTITPALRWVVSEHYEYSWVQANGSINTFKNSIPNGTVSSEKVLQLNNPQAGPVIGV